MIIDARELHDGATVTADICIVGAGVAGITLASEFLGSQLSVAIVESGDLEPNARTQSLNVGRNIGVPYYELDQTRARGVGGTSHNWRCKIGESNLGVRLMGLDPIDFEKRPWVPNSGWPFGKTELDRFYTRAHAFCEIGPYSYTVDGWKLLLPPEDVPLMDESTIVETKIFQFSNRRLWYKTYREVIDRSHNVALYINATVLKVQSNPTATAVTHLEARTLEGKGIRFEAKQYVLAGGGLEVPRLMLLSRDIQPAGLGNNHDNVGRYFMEHPHIWTGYIIPAEKRLFERLRLYQMHTVEKTPIMGKFSLSAETQRRERLLNFTTSIHPQSRNLPLKGVSELNSCLARLKGGRFGPEDRRHLRYVFQNFGNLGRHVMRKIRREIDRGYRQRLREPNVLTMNPMSEQIPNPESRVLLGSDKDIFGQERVELAWRLTSQDISSIRRSQELLGAEWRRYGLGELVVQLTDDSLPANIHGGWHHMGTTRMNDNPKQGVVDRNSRVHGIANLYIAGASVFPTVGCANPVLTLIALSLRLSEYLKTRVAS